MIKKQNLEARPLYSKWEADWQKDRITCGDLKGEAINVFCEKCRSNQTFNCKYFILNDENKSRYRPNTSLGKDEARGILTLAYKCAHCNESFRTFVIHIDNNGYMKKIGQFPPLDIAIPKEISSLNNKEIKELYLRGRTSENQGYGIGAFSYYRRIVELCIEELINDIEKIIPPDKKVEYINIIKKLKAEKTAEGRINLIKDTIVDTSIHGNPISKLYELSSIGIHKLSDEKCLEFADSLRTLLIYTIEEISREKNKKEGLKKAMDKIEKLISD